MVVVLVVPCHLVLRVWWPWHGVDVCGRWWLTGLQGLGAAVRWWWRALAVAVLLVCPGGLGVGWCGVAKRPRRTSLLPGMPHFCGSVGGIGIGETQPGIGIGV